MRDKSGIRVVKIMAQIFNLQKEFRSFWEKYITAELREIKDFHCFFLDFISLCVLTNSGDMSTYEEISLEEKGNKVGKTVDAILYRKSFGISIIPQFDRSINAKTSTTDTVKFQDRRILPKVPTCEAFESHDHSTSMKRAILDELKITKDQFMRLAKGKGILGLIATAMIEAASNFSIKLLDWMVNTHTSMVKH